MIQAPFSPLCDCCGLPIRPGVGEDCPRCKYPINVAREEHFLESSLSDLQRIAEHGGADLTVRGLIARYWARLNYLRSLQAGVLPQKSFVKQPAILTEAREPGSVLIPSMISPQVKPPVSSVSPLKRPTESVPPEPAVPAMPLFPAGSKQAEKVPAPNQSPAPVSSAAVITPEERPQFPTRRGFSFSWRSFVVDQAITIIGLLGAFLILMGALSSVVTTGGNPLLSFLIVFGVHAFFGIAGVVAYRLENFKLIARIYSGIYVLLVPLVGFTGYNLMLGSQITLSLPTLIAIAAAYAAVVYTLLAIYQGFSIYGYLGAMALIVVDLAAAANLHLNYGWWPSMLMPLALAALTCIVRSPATRRERYFTGMLVVLRQPVRVFMYTIVGICLLSAVAVTLISLSPESTFFNTSMGEIRFSILSMSALLLIWTAAWSWLTKRTRELPVLAFLFLACVLAFCYAFDFSQSGYALALVSVALLYHGLNRFAVTLLQPLGKLGLYLDLITLVLVCLVPFIGSPLLPQQLFSVAYQLPLDSNPNLYVPAHWAAVAELIAVGLGCLLSVSISLLHANHRGETENRHNYWPWLLLLSGFLLNWEVSAIVLSLNLVSVWFFVGLTLVIMGIAVLVRQRFGSYWANPIDVLVLGEALLTLSLSLNQSSDQLSTLLLGFAALLYAVVLYQRRQRLLFLPLVFAVLALPILLSSRPYVALLMGTLLPFVAVAIRRIMANRTLAVSADIATKSGWAMLWEWPLVAVALLYGAVTGLIDILISQYSGSSQSIVGSWLRVTFPIALELAALSLAWYASAALARIKWWLIPAIGFAGVAVLLPGIPFWVLATVTPVAAMLGFGVSRSFDRTWASPLYIVALLSAVMTGIVGYQNPALLLATSWILVGFGLLAYIIGLLEGLEPCLWLLPAFTTWALLDAAQLGDLYRPPIVALLYAGIGVAIGLVHAVRLPSLETAKKNSFLKYALPFYASAFAAAVLTGVYGMLPGAKPPFYGAIPDALLVYALAAFGILLFERRPRWLWLVAGFAAWATLLAMQQSIFYVTGIGLGTGILGVFLGRLIKQRAVNSALSGPFPTTVRLSWGWPWYLASLVAAIVVACWPIYTIDSSGFAEYVLLAFAVLAYIAGISEDFMPLLWVAPLLTTVSLIYSATSFDAVRLLIVALVCAALGVATSGLKFILRFVGANRRVFYYALPFYTTAFVAAILTGMDSTSTSVNPLFYLVVMMLYALIAYAIALFEHQPYGLFIMAGFAIWGTLLAPRASIAWVIGIAITTALTGLLLGRMTKRPQLLTAGLLSRYWLTSFIWGWPWYLISLVAMIWTVAWQQIFGTESQTGIVAYSLLAFTAIAVCIMLVERVPEMLVLPAIFAALAIWLWQPHLDITTMMVAFSILCVLIFVSQLLWKVITPWTRIISASLLHNVVGIGGQFLIILVTIGNGGLFASSGPLAFVGAGSLFVLTLMAFCDGRIQENKIVQRCCDYAAGLLVSLVVSWTLTAFGQTNLDLLTLAPATYLTIIAPLLLRDETLPEHRIIGEGIAVLGAALLLLPTLWLSFTQSDGNLLYTLVLMGEALALLLLGIGAGMRIFALTGAGLIVVAALHALFMPTLGIPTPLALTILGVMLLAIATGLSLVRRRLRTAWSQWD